MNHIAIVQDTRKDSRFMLTTTDIFSTIIGPRLCKSERPWPDLPVRGLTKKQAEANATIFDDYLEKQERSNPKAKKRA